MRAWRTISGLTTCEASPSSRAHFASTEGRFPREDRCARNPGMPLIPCTASGRESILTPTGSGVAPDDCGGRQYAYHDQNDVRRVVVARTLDHDLRILGALNDDFLHVSSLLRTSENCPDPCGDKEWNKRGTRETKAFPNRDGNHASLQLCNPLRENCRKNRGKRENDSANNMSCVSARSV